MDRQKQRILIVDDELSVLKLLRRVLGAQYDLLVAPTGYELRMMVDHFEPNLIIMDLEFPDDNGRDLCREIRKNKDYDPMAILLLSGLDEPDVAAAAIQAGVDGYMTKPFDVSILRSTVAHLISSKQQAPLQIAR